MNVRKLLPVLALSAVLPLGCADDPPTTEIHGEAGTLTGDGMIGTWARLDSAGTIRSVGVSIDVTTVLGAANQAELFLRFPEQVRAETFIDHLGIDFNPHGHGPPGTYDLPHFDIHFYGVTGAERERISCADQPMPAPERIPATYVIPSTAAEPAGTCVPGMGVHALDSTSPELHPQQPQRFEKTFILGYDRGALAFLEPMVTREALLQGASFDRQIPLPRELGRQTLWPRRVTASLGMLGNYTIELGDFVAVEQ